ncbi:MAG: hypothetical protein KF802_13140 [Bdellovibrionaceae bacterium]|nr:hypothetical protein [Pseudobdellovibrionaceae bacterium]
MTTFFGAVLCLQLLSCAAAPVKYSDGYQESKNSAGVYTVRFTGNGHTSPEAVEKALERRCAELTLREGYDWFTFYTKSRNDHVGMRQKSVPSFYGVIHMHRGPVGEDGFDAKKIVAEPMPAWIESD